MTPQDTLDNLKKTTNQRCHRTLDAIYDVCLKQQESGSNDFTVSTIAKVGATQGVPRAQSIRNKTGESYRILIDSFSMPNGKKIKLQSKKDDWIEKIQDWDTKLLVRLQEAKLKKAENIIKEYVPINTVIQVNDFHGEKSLRTLSKVEKRALEHILSPEFIEKFNLIKGENGEMETIDGEQMFKVATIGAIQKALEFL
ncbi:MAG: hypothetical protein methR_P1015 [Methyloprofundus sp.]|nr:MAG: hypothetical protein methR_P1015 [Methyloprofundus sp.]